MIGTANATLPDLSESWPDDPGKFLVGQALACRGSSKQPWQAKACPTSLPRLQRTTLESQGQPYEKTTWIGDAHFTRRELAECTT